MRLGITRHLSDDRQAANDAAKSYQSTGSGLAGTAQLPANVVPAAAAAGEAQAVQASNSPHSSSVGNGGWDTYAPAGGVAPSSLAAMYTQPPDANVPQTAGPVGQPATTHTITQHVQQIKPA